MCMTELSQYASQKMPKQVFDPVQLQKERLSKAAQGDGYLES
jgi:hypothetical protein